MSVTVTAPRRLVRDRKARTASRVSCGCYILRGERIVSIAGGPWICRRCYLADLTSVMKQAPQPSERG